MKWPDCLCCLRHDTSRYNVLRQDKAADPVYRAFVKEFERDPRSELCCNLAHAMAKKFTLGVGDARTPLDDPDGTKAVVTGQRLSEMIDLPDVIYVSPYLRTEETLQFLIQGWLQLTDVRVIREERIREQEHGLALIYNDWRIFHTLHPDQRRLHELEGPYRYRYPQGESVPDVRERVGQWFGAVTRDFAGKKVLVVTHHLTILAVRANLDRLDEQGFRALDEHDKPANCGVTLYRGDPDQGRAGKLILEYYNRVFY